MQVSGIWIDAAIREEGVMDLNRYSIVKSSDDINNI